uniref:Type II secretion system protein M n=1 Tax=Candidatus Kentrum sp. LFY TaxID=2126342 RepID=A0A450UDB9_9GAMM|nr:MAG: general secretion pathway protein M [Candidatus Kentron sp. LFY]
MISKFLDITRIDAIKPRDRVALAVGGVAVMLSLVYFLVVEPLHDRARYLTHQVSRQEADLQWMRQAAKNIIRLRESAAAGEGTSRPQSLLIVVDDSARKAGISQAVKRIEPASEKSVRVWVEDAAFDDLLHWFGELRARGVRGNNVAIERRKTSGRVNVKATLGWPP